MEEKTKKKTCKLGKRNNCTYRPSFPIFYVDFVPKDT